MADGFELHPNPSAATYEGLELMRKQWPGEQMDVAALSYDSHDES